MKVGTVGHGYFILLLFCFAAVQYSTYPMLPFKYTYMGMRIDVAYAVPIVPSQRLGGIGEKAGKYK